MYRARTSKDSRYCEDPRHNEAAAKGNGGKVAVGVIENQSGDSYAVCESCRARIFDTEIKAGNEEYIF